MSDDTASIFGDTHLPDIREIVQTLWRRRMLIAYIVAGTVLVGLVGILLFKPKEYKATVTLMVGQHAVNLNNFQDVTAGPAFDDTSVQTEANILQSPDLVLKTINKLGLDKLDEFSSSSGGMQRVVSNVLNNLTVTPQGTSRVIDVTFESEDPVLAAKVANTLTAYYLASQVDFKKRQIQELNGWFNDKVKDLQADVTRNAQAVEDFRATGNVLTGKDAQDVIYQQITDISSQLAPIEVHKFDVQSRLAAIDALQSSGHPDAVEDVAKSPVIQNLKTQASTISQNVESLRSEYGPNHPKLIAAKRQLEQVNAAIAAETANIKNSLKNDATATEAQEAMLNTQLEALRKQAIGVRGKLITLDQLQAQQDSSQKILDTFLDNSKNIQSQLTFARPDAVVVDYATPPPLPSQPSRTVLMLAVIVFSGFLALGVVFTLEMLRGGIGNFDDVRKLGQSPLGVLPIVEAPANAMLAKENSSFKEAVKRIYMASLMKNAAKTILVTSALPNEGRTTFTLSLAHYLMSIGHTVAVIDADFFRPSLSQSTRTPKGPGFTDVLAGNATLDSVIDRDVTGLTVIRAGAAGKLSPDLLRPEKLHDLLAALHQSYAYVLIDSGPLLAHSEAIQMASQADGIVVVTEWLRTSQKNFGNMLGMLERFSPQVLGIVINKVDIGKYKAFNAGSDFLLPNIARA